MTNIDVFENPDSRLSKTEIRTLQELSKKPDILSDLDAYILQNLKTDLQKQLELYQKRPWTPKQSKDYIEKLTNNIINYIDWISAFENASAKVTAWDSVFNKPWQVDDIFQIYANIGKTELDSNNEIDTFESSLQQLQEKSWINWPKTLRAACASLWINIKELQKHIWVTADWIIWWQTYRAFEKSIISSDSWNIDIKKTDNSNNENVEFPWKSPALEKMIHETFDKINLDNFNLSDVFALVNMESWFDVNAKSGTWSVWLFQTTQIVIEDMKIRSYLYDDAIIKEMLQRNWKTDISQMKSRNIRMDPQNSADIWLLFLKALEEKKDNLSNNMLNSFSKNIDNIYKRVDYILWWKWISVDKSHIQEIIQELQVDLRARDKFLKMKNYNWDLNKYKWEIYQHRYYYAFCVYYMWKYWI